MDKLRAIEYLSCAVETGSFTAAAKSLGVSVANVYVTRHRVKEAVKKETKRVEKELERKITEQVGKSARAGKGRF